MDTELRPRYADVLDPADAVAVDPAEIIAVVVAYVDGAAVATAALKRTHGHAEIKRVFVAPGHRRRGLAALVLAEVEAIAREEGYRDIVLETGERQPEAIALYAREGWLPIPPFGHYTNARGLGRYFAKPLEPLLVGVELPAAAARGAALATQAAVAARAFDRAGADLLVVRDVPVPAEGEVAIDAVTLAAVIAPATTRIALVPAVAVTHTEPFHLSKAVQTLDLTSLGRAGWQPTVSISESDAALFGRRAAPGPDDAWAEALEAIEVSRRLWDSWEDDAIIRDVATGRYIDRARVHRIDFVGEHFRVVGPSIVPRSVQGLPPVVVQVGRGDAAALAAGSATAEVLRVHPEDLARARDAAADAGRAPTVLVDVDACTTTPGCVRETLATLRHDAGADGAVLVFDRIPAAPDEWAAALAPFATAAPAASFRERLGLPRPASRYAREAESRVDA